jgi:catechol 2,3-dioxygenase-like lactoylglutathione lyase family enzyme
MERVRTGAKSGLEDGGRAGLRLRRLQHVSSPYPAGRQEEVRAFYGKLLGLVEIPPPRSIAHMQLVWFSAGPGTLEMHFFPGVPDPQHARHLCLEVDNLDAARRQLEAAGFAPYEDIAIPHRPRFFCRDPFGNLLELTTILGDYRQAEGAKAPE